MKKIKQILLIFTILISASLYSQLSCGTPQNSTVQHFSNGSDNNFSVNSAPICINVQFHIVRTTAGTGGATTTTLDQVTNLLNNHFNPHNININKVGFDYINNSTFYDMTDAEFNSLVATNNNPNAINFYIINSCSSWIGRAGDITSRNFVMVNSYCNTGVSAHELGHCLNLWHTFQGTLSGTSGCAELINGSNCSSCGDYVCDTPADARTGISGGYTPDMTNDMSYYNAFTLDHFSNLQGSRMRDALNGSPILQSVMGSLCKSIIGSDNLCMSPNQTYTVSNSASSNVIWSVTPNIQIVFQNPTTLIIRAISNNSAVGKITATVNGLTISKSIHLGSPTITNYGISGPSNPNIYINDVSNFSVSTAKAATSYIWSITSNPNCGCYTNANGFLICPQGTILPRFIGNPTSNNATVQWGNCSGQYTVNCSAVNPCGSTGIGNFTVSVYKPGSGGGTGGGDLPCEPSISIFPNPVKGQTLEVSIAPPSDPCRTLLQSYKTANTDKIVKTDNMVKIYNMQGIVVFENNYDSEKDFTINGINLKAGLYILNITFPDGKTNKQKIVVE
jgi:Secretion system C-terminal sorting domain/Astacin (Peptidase family M12A)